MFGTYCASIWIMEMYLVLLTVCLYFTPVVKSDHQHINVIS